MNENQNQLPASANTAKLLCRCLAVMTLIGQLAQAASLGTAFTYQGRLFIGDVPANGLYDLEFTNYDLAAGGNALGGFNTNALPVTNGLFTVTLDFGAVFDGTPRWLEISERTNSTGAFGTLAPRQLLAAAPYATYAASAGTVPGLTIVQNADGAPNVIGGSTANWVASGVVGATIGGGGATNYNGNAFTNNVSANFGTIGGGSVNTIQTMALWATIGGGWGNTIQTNAQVATISGGLGNTIQTIALAATISGGAQNTVQSNAEFATIGGGSGNTIQTNATYATIGGGYENTIQDSANEDFPNEATIGGGFQNTIQSTAEAATIGGGYQNTIQTNAFSTTIGGGETNTIQILAHRATIGGGYQNTIQEGAWGGTIGGGWQNTILSAIGYATIPGGFQNSATSFAFAAGSGAKAVNQGAFVWADSTGGSFSSTANNQFAVRATGGVRFVTTGAGMTVDGAVTATAFNTSSDRNLKEHLGAVKPRERLCENSFIR